MGTYCRTQAGNGESGSVYCMGQSRLFGNGAKECRYWYSNGRETMAIEDTETMEEMRGALKWRLGDTARRYYPVGVEPNRLTLGTLQRLKEAFSRGATVTIAANYAGIPKPTLYRWLNDGELDFIEGNDKTILYSLFSAVAMERGEVALRMMDSVLVAAEDTLKPDWKAGAWWLERNYKEELGRQPEVVNNVGDNRSMTVINGSEVDYADALDTVTKLASKVRTETAENETGTMVDSEATDRYRDTA